MFAQVYRRSAFAADAIAEAMVRFLRFDLVFPYLVQILKLNLGLFSGARSDARRIPE